MAQMHPRSIVYDSSGHAERQVFTALREALPDDYHVIHGVRWVSRRRDRAYDGEADFVLVHPQRGVMVLEVKGGLIRYDAASGQWSTTPRGGSQPQLIRDPFLQATNNKYDLHKYLATRPGWNPEWGPFTHAVCFPGGVLESSPLPEMHPELTLYADDVGDPGCLRPRIDAAFALGASQAPLGREGIHQVVQALAHDIEMRQPLGLLIEESEREILRLTESQYHVLLGLAGNARVAVSGPAGSGKTMLAVEKAKRLAADGLDTLLTCYNRPLADHLAQSLSDRPRLTILTFHQLCWKLAKQAGLSPPDPPRSAADFRRLADLLEPAQDRLGVQFDALVVDEGQDFEAGWWLPLQMLLRDPDRGHFYLFHDSNQAIYGRPTGLPERLIPFALVENKRNTRAIFAEVMRFYGGDQPIHCKGPEGVTVRRRRLGAGGLREALTAELEYLVGEGRIDRSDIVVLTPKALERSDAAGTFGRFELSERGGRPNHIKLSTIHRYKGLEAKAVILCELPDRHTPEFKTLMYVACSRPRSLLSVIE